MIETKSFTAEELGIANENIKNTEGLKFYNFKSEPFRIYGLYDAQNPERTRHCRMPVEVAEKVSAGVKWLNYNLAGGRVRFTTTSNYLALKLTRDEVEVSPKFSYLARGGVDVYIRRGKVSEPIFSGIFMPTDTSLNIESLIKLPAGEKQITLVLSNYSGLRDLFIGLDENSTLTAHPDYTIEKPVLFYGSSITQGGCPTRPGMSYENIISRRYDVNYINLGFSGNAKAEDAMADYLAGLDFSVFVCDYDHNAPTVEHLENTHEKLYLKIREKHPTTPVIFVTKPDFWLKWGECERRRDVIYNTYINAKNRGENVIFIDGYSLFAGQNREDCTVDGCHPNDLGMFRMAEVIGKAVEFALRDINV